MQRICGMNEVTNADPNLAPNGKHLLMTHQPVLTANLKYEINLGLNDLKLILKKYNYEVIAIQSYTNGWPVNRVKAGNDIGSKTPYKNLYIVGDGAKAECIEVDGIAMAVKNLMRDLL
jgi:phytoene dehydrogenase-like protein